MSHSICRSVLERNFSSLSVSNHSTSSRLEWITSGFSFVICFLGLMSNAAALFVMFNARGTIKLTYNRYLVNLALADLLRACFIPFTVIARMKRNFIFGTAICQLLPVIQGVGVSVDVLTLVCISIERYFAICHPFIMMKLKSLSYSSFFNNLIIIFIWTLGFLIALPNYYMHDLCFLPIAKRYKCERIRLESLDDRLYMIVLDVLYFVIPMTVMIILYTFIMMKMSMEPSVRQIELSQTRPENMYHVRRSYPPLTYVNLANHSDETKNDKCSALTGTESLPNQMSNKGSKRKNFRMDRQRRKALKLLILLIVEFFVCWMPLYIYHTIGTFHKSFYRSIPSVILDMILLFSFASTACNPVTYYFMSERYRSVLFDIFNSSCRRFFGTSSRNLQQRRTNERTSTSLQDRRERIMANTARSMKSNPI